MAVSFILVNLRTLRYRLQLTGKASIPEYICMYVCITTIYRKTAVPENTVPDTPET